MSVKQKQSRRLTLITVWIVTLSPWQRNELEKVSFIQDSWLSQLSWNKHQDGRVFTASKLKKYTSLCRTVFSWKKDPSSRLIQSRVNICGYHFIKYVQYLRRILLTIMLHFLSSFFYSDALPSTKEGFHFLIILAFYSLFSGTAVVWCFCYLL